MSITYASTKNSTPIEEKEIGLFITSPLLLLTLTIILTLTLSGGTNSTCYFIDIPPGWKFHILNQPLSPLMFAFFSGIAHYKKWLWFNSNFHCKCQTASKFELGDSEFRFNYLRGSIHTQTAMLNIKNLPLVVWVEIVVS